MWGKEKIFGFFFLKKNLSKCSLKYYRNCTLQKSLRNQRIACVRALHSTKSQDQDASSLKRAKATRDSGRFAALFTSRQPKELRNGEETSKSCSHSVWNLELELRWRSTS